MPRFVAFAASLLFITSAVLADENPRHQVPSGDPVAARHYVMQMEHTLRPAEEAALAANGVVVQHVMPGNRYLVRAQSTAVLEGNPNVRSIGPLDPERKLDRLALRASASSSPHVTLNVRFHADVTPDEAMRAVEAAGGTVETPMDIVYRSPERLTVRLAPGSVARLAANDGVLGVYGRLKAAPVNAVAALISHVTPLYSAPYNLDGTGITLSLFEAPDSAGNSSVDATHPEFGGRVTKHDTSGASEHATHVVGTMIASGIDSKAKGMAPNASVHQYPVDDSFLDGKQNNLSPLGVVADNNSWGFQLGWQQQSDRSWVWFGATDYFGGYDGFYSAPYDKIAHNLPVLFVHSAGNDGDQGFGPENPPWNQHKHVDDNFDIIKNETFCTSQNGSGTDCPAATCTAGISTKAHDDFGNAVPHCEKTHHGPYGPFNTMSFIASEKNVLAIAAVDQSHQIAGFSSRGPARDGRVKPDLSAKGVHQYSTFPNNSYSYESGTSMSSPVVTGISALVVQQWKQTFGGSPTPEQIKTLLIAGADDIGNPGPDYTYGFGLVDAQATVDLIRADNNTGSRIRNGSVAQGDTVQFPLTVTSPGPLRVVLGWNDPEVILGENDFADTTLVNDLDVKVIDPSGATVLPYVLDKNNVDTPAARGVNTVDNTEEVEEANATAGVYKVVVTATKIATGPKQDFVLVANNTLGAAAVPCGDPYEPNDTAATAYRYLISGERITAKTCSTTDFDFYVVKPTASGAVSVTVTASDTPLRVTITGGGSADIAAGASATVSTNGTVGAGEYTIEVQPTGTIGSKATYTLTPSFNSASVPRTRRVNH